MTGMAVIKVSGDNWPSERNQKEHFSRNIDGFSKERLFRKNGR